MRRRLFIKKLLFGIQAMVLCGLIPRPHLAAALAGIREDGLHYRPLSGRSLREIALEKRHHDAGRFVNPVGLPLKGRFWHLLNWKLLQPNRFRPYLDTQPVTPVAIDWHAVRRHRGVSLTFIKHASLMIKDVDRYLLIDPVFSEIFWFIRDFSPLTGTPSAMPEPDHVMLTHGHYDHMDTASLAGFRSDTHVISPLGYDRVFKRLGMRHRSRLDWYDTFSHGDLQITLLPGNHWTMRSPLAGPNRSLWGGYLIRTAAGKTLYVSGDTAYFDGFAELGREFDIDLAVINLGAYEPRWFMASSHINPAETVQAVKELNPKAFMIVHWGTFRLGDEPVHFPPRDLEQALQRHGMSDRWIRLNHGETVFLDRIGR